MGTHPGRGPAHYPRPHPRRPRLADPAPSEAPPAPSRAPPRGPAPPEAPSRWSCLVPNRLLPGLAALGCPGTSLRRAARAPGFPWRPGAGSVGASPGARRPAPTGPAQLWEPLVLPAPVPHHTPATHILKPGPVPGRPPWGEPSVERAGRSPLSPGITARVWGKGRNARRGGQLSRHVPHPLRNTWEGPRRRQNYASRWTLISDHRPPTGLQFGVSLSCPHPPSHIPRWPSLRFLLMAFLEQWSHQKGALTPEAMSTGDVL